MPIRFCRTVCPSDGKTVPLAFSLGQARSLPVGEEVFFPNTFLMHSYVQYTELQIGTKVLQDVTVTVVVIWPVAFRLDKISYTLHAPSIEISKYNSYDR